MIKKREVFWALEKNAHMTLVGKHECMEPSGGPVRDRDNFKMEVEQDGRAWSSSVWLMVGACGRPL